MAQAYSSIVLDHTADEVWKVIRPFDHYAWAGVLSETVIEDGRRGDQVGAIRRVAIGDAVRRQQLLAHSDVERSYTYAFLEPLPFAARNYVATLSVRPVTMSGQAFVEWSARFDCVEGSSEAQQRMTRFFEQEGFAVWLAALRNFMAGAR